jgi:hypothetical protein
MPHAKQSAWHHAVAVAHLGEAMKHHRRAVRHKACGDYETAMYHLKCAQISAKRAVKYHGEARKADVNTTNEFKNVTMLH